MKTPFKKNKQKGRVPLNQTGKPKSAFSYYAGNKTSNSNDSIRARQATDQKVTLMNKLRLIPTIIALSIILLSVAFSTTLSNQPTVKFLGGSSPYNTPSYYSDEVEKILNTSVRNKSKLTIDTNKVEELLLSSFPELDVATVALPVIGRRPTITMHVRQPALILTTSSNAYVLDSAGKVVAEARQLLSESKVGLITVQDQSGLLIEIGSQALTTESVTFISNLKFQLTDKKLDISQATLPITPNQIDIRIKDLPYYLKADMSGSARMQIGAFLATRDRGIVPNEYMDVRVEEKVFYK